MYKAFEFRIYPGPEQALLINKTFGCARKVYNLMLAEKKKHYDETGKVPRVTPAGYKAEYPYLKEVDSLALANEQLHLEAAYRNFFRDPSVGAAPVQKQENRPQILHHQSGQREYPDRRKTPDPPQAGADQTKAAPEYTGRISLEILYGQSKTLRKLLCIPSL